MVLESLNNLNIKRMVLETPEKPEELPFDVERDITEEDCNGMRRYLEGYKESDNWIAFSWQAMEMKALNPNIDLNLDTVAWKGMKRKLEENRHDRPWDFVRHAAHVKALYPDVDLEFDKASREDMEHKLKENEEKGPWGNIATLAKYLKILSPNTNFNLSKEIWNGIRQELKDLRRASSWANFAYLAAAVKIIDPNADLNLDKEAWDGMRAALEKQRSTNLYNEFPTLAFSMKVLIAQEIKITNKGLELTMPKPKVKPTKDIPPMPEVKKF